MTERIADMGISASMVSNTAMMLSGGLRDTSRKPLDIKPIGLQRIEVVDRERPVDPAKVAELADSIQREGLLQPIGIRRASTGNQYRLVYGAHRLAAAKLIAKDDPTQDVIAAVIFPPNMPDWACKMAELAENLFRKDLSAKQKEAETALLAGLIKKHDRNADPKTVGHQTRANGKSSDPHHVGLRTVTQQVAATLGVSGEHVRRRISNAAKLAERQGLVIETNKRTPEGLTGDQLIAIGQAAQTAADSDKRQAQKEGRPPRHVNPHQSLGENKALARLDVTDPQPFIDWCRKRLAGKHKPMSLDILRAYRSAIDNLIEEYEAKPS